MKQHELNKLTPEEKRVKIATACGWHSIKQCTCKCEPHGLPAGVTSERGYKHLPNFLNSLDAMAEAEESLSASKRELFANILFNVIFHPDDSDEWPTEVNTAGYHTMWDGLFTMMHATAEQRASAFLLTIG